MYGGFEYAPMTDPQQPWRPGRAGHFSELDRLLEDSQDADNPSASGILSIFSAVRTIAVVGLSRDPLKAARRVPAYLAAKGYLILPVNPNATETRILGHQVVGHLDDVRDRIDMVLVFRPSFEAEGVVRDACARPERPVIWLQEGIWGGAQAATGREAGRTIVQNLCAFKAHRATGLR